MKASSWGEAKWVESVIVWSKNLLNFKLLWRMNGGEREEEEGEQRGERDHQDGSRVRRKKERGSCELTKMPLPLFIFLPQADSYNISPIIRSQKLSRFDLMTNEMNSKIDNLIVFGFLLKLGLVNNR